MAEVWGLTGGVASGKSTAAGFFAAHGIPVLDADMIVRALSEKGGAAHELIGKRFGTSDRGALREIVFSDVQARQDLEKILHPLIRAESARQIEAVSAGGAKVVLYEAALLVETGRYKDLHGLIVVESPRGDREKRLMARDGAPLELVRKMISAQASDESRRAVATVVLQNSGTLSELSAAVSRVVEERSWR